MKQKGALTGRGSRKEEEEKGRKMGHEVVFDFLCVKTGSMRGRGNTAALL